MQDNQHIDQGQVKAVSNAADLFAAALREALTHDLSDEGLDKHFWLDVAEELGQETAQDLYHAAVFCTRVLK